jgi:hypothetical protein
MTLPKPDAMLDANIETARNITGGKPKFADAYQQREFLKGRLAAAFRIFGKLGYDEGVAGHLTCRVSDLLEEIRLTRLRSVRTLSKKIHSGSILLASPFH